MDPYTRGGGRSGNGPNRPYNNHNNNNNYPPRQSNYQGNHRGRAPPPRNQQYSGSNNRNQYAAPPAYDDNDDYNDVPEHQQQQSRQHQGGGGQQKQQQQQKKNPPKPKEKSPWSYLPHENLVKMDFNRYTTAKSTTDARSARRSAIIVKGTMNRPQFRTRAVLTFGITRKDDDAKYTISVGPARVSRRPDGTLKKWDSDKSEFVDLTEKEEMLCRKGIEANEYFEAIMRKENPAAPIIKGPFRTSLGYLDPAKEGKSFEQWTWRFRLSENDEEQYDVDFRDIDGSKLELEEAIAISCGAEAVMYGVIASTYATSEKSSLIMRVKSIHFQKRGTPPYDPDNIPEGVYMKEIPDDMEYDNPELFKGYAKPKVLTNGEPTSAAAAEKPYAKLTLALTDGSTNRKRSPSAATSASKRTRLGEEEPSSDNEEDHHLDGDHQDDDGHDYHSFAEEDDDEEEDAVKRPSKKKTMQSDYSDNKRQHIEAPDVW